MELLIFSFFNGLQSVIFFKTRTVTKDQCSLKLSKVSQILSIQVYLGTSEVNFLE